SLVDYDYTQSVVKLTAQRTQHSESTQDNAEEYAWGDYAQPLATPLGVSGRPNDANFEAEHLAQVKVEAHRAQSRLASGSGNLRGLMTGYKFRLEGYPLTPGDGEYLVVSTELEIVNNDTVTHRGALERRYQCETHFTAVPADTFYRTPQTAVKPRAYGEMAVVVGFDDQDKLLTDPYGRVKVHFVWDRVSPLNDTASCWLQVASPWQGPGYGALWTPRVGQMVQIGYFDSDPDRPFVMAAHSTENHQLPWELPRNSVLSGWRSRDLNGQSANSVLTDDTPGKLQVQVASDHAQSRLVLGSNTRIDGHKGRSEARGVGFELATEAHGVLRANAGLLMTTEARIGATSPVKDMGETVARLTQARGQHEELGRLAQQHLAQTAAMSQADAAQAIKTQNEAIKGGAKAHDNPSPEMTRPDVVLASSAGIATTAAESTHQASGENHAITAGRDMSVSLGRSLFASVRGAISMFAYQLGLKLIAAKGKVEIQAQSDQLALAALKDVTISSTDGKVVITASKEVWIGAGGSYVQINGSGIVNGSPGPILEKGASWDVPGPSLKFARTPTFATHPIEFDCGETGTFDTSSTLSSTFLLPAPPEASASTANPEPASTKIDLPRSAEAGKIGTCTWNMSGVVETVSPKAGCADYLAVDKAGNPYPSQQSQLHANYASFGGTFDLAYDQASKSITATVRVLVEPKQVRQTEPDGTTKIVSYDHDLDAYGAPGRTVEDRPAAAVSAFLRSEKAKIERDLNQNGYFLTKADCEKGAGCGCKIPVSFCVELLTADSNKIAHTTVNLHPASVRANSGNWSEVVNYVDPQTKVEKPWPTVHHVLSHEVGHLFSFPDEYYWGGGAVHRTYVKADSTIDLPLAKNNPDKNVWQGTTADSLMGGGVYDSVAMTPPYYLVHICDWFKSKNGITWKAVKSKEP
uniref:type VI secretion system Vgr family protein n=1 Tax=Caballeronia sp. AZ10_KS36 TaxID=2921757 RepID=UPI0020297375